MHMKFKKSATSADLYVIHPHINFL